jgi:PAS domain S-box-containing protein
MGKLRPPSILPVFHPRIMRLNAHLLALALFLILLYPLASLSPIPWEVTGGAILVSVTILPLLYLAPWKKASPRVIYLVSLLFISLVLLLIRNTGGPDSPFSPLFFLLSISHGTLYPQMAAFAFTTMAAGGYLAFLLPHILPLGPLTALQAEKTIIFLPLLYLSTYLSHYLSQEIRSEAAQKEEKEALVQDLVRRNLEIFAFSSLTALHHLLDLRSALLEALGKALDFLHQKAGFLVCWAGVASTQGEPLLVHRGPIQEILPQVIPLLRTRLPERPDSEGAEDCGRLDLLYLDQEEGLPNLAPAGLEEKCLIYLPLTIHNEAIGLLGILVQDTTSLSPYDRQFLRGIADQVSLVIENAVYLQSLPLIWQESPQQWQKAFLLREASPSLPSPLSVDTILKALVDDLSGFLKASRVGIFVCPQDKASPYLYIARDEAKSPPALPYPIDLRLYPELQAALQQATILKIEDVATHPLMKEVRGLLQLSEVFSLTLSPIRIQERTVGLISLGQRAPARPFSEPELQLCQALAEQAAMAIENAGLYFRALDLANRVEQEKIFRQSLIESLASGLISVDFDGRINSLNEAAEKILGYRREEVMGAALSALIGEEEVGSFQFGLWREGVGSARQRGQWRTQEGRRILVEFSLSPHLSPHGKVLGAVISFQDVTEEDRLREELRRVERLASLGTMAAGIAHELRNPLANIRIAVQALERRLSSQEIKLTVLTMFT